MDSSLKRVASNTGSMSTSVSETYSESQPLVARKGGPAALKWSWLKIVRGVGTAVCIVMMVISWITMAEKLQVVGKEYKKPFFQTYFIHSSYTIIYIVWKIWLIFPGNFSCNKVGEGKLTNFKWLAFSTGFLAVIIYASACLWYLSLTRTSLSANTAIYQSASAVVFIISIPILRERVTLLKISSVAFTVAGVTMVSVFSQDRNPAHVNNTLSAVGGDGSVWSNHDEGAELVAATPSPEINTPLGYVYLVLSTILYAASEVGFKKLATEPDDPATLQNGVRGVGYIGVHTLFLFWPLLVILHFTGAETFELPSLSVLKLLFLNCFLDIIFNLGLYVCVALSSPLIATIGAVLVVPASVVVDWLVHQVFLDWEAYVGVGLIICGFFVLVFSEGWEIFYWEKRVHAQDEAALARLELAQGKRQNTFLTNLLHTMKKRGWLYYML